MAMQDSDFLDLILGHVYSDDIVLFLKGTADVPQDNWSAGVVLILRNMGLSFKDVDVLPDYNFRKGLTHLTNYPSIPQLYIKGNFIGGYDLVCDMYAKGELRQLLQEKGLLEM